MAPRCALASDCLHIYVKRFCIWTTCVLTVCGWHSLQIASRSALHSLPSYLICAGCRLWLVVKPCQIVQRRQQQTEQDNGDCHKNGSAGLCVSQFANENCRSCERQRQQQWQAKNAFYAAKNQQRNHKAQHCSVRYTVCSLCVFRLLYRLCIVVRTTQRAICCSETTSVISGVMSTQARMRPHY